MFALGKEIRNHKYTKFRYQFFNIKFRFASNKLMVRQKIFKFHKISFLTCFRLLGIQFLLFTFIILWTFMILGLYLQCKSHFIVGKNKLTLLLQQL